MGSIHTIATAHASDSAGVCSIESSVLKTRSNLPAVGGISLKPQHYVEILRQHPDAGWFEIHAENYLGAGGPPLHYLQKIRERYPLSVHGVGMSIGSADGLNEEHLNRVAVLLERFEPDSFSEHLAWSSHDSEFFSDLLPMPYTREVEDLVCSNIDQIQTKIRRRMLLENPTNYLVLETSTMEEADFLSNVIRRTGCGLLLDVNNVYVSAMNCGYSAEDYLRSLPLDSIGEIHLAGYSVDDIDGQERLLIDSHDREVADAVWSLFEFTIATAGIRPALIEWDSSIPTLETMLAEKLKADNILTSATEESHVAS